MGSQYTSQVRQIATDSIEWVLIENAVSSSAIIVLSVGLRYF